MKILAAVVLTGMAVSATSSAFAFRDESQSVLLARAIAAKKAAATQPRTGVAGPVGVPGRVGPATETNRNRKDPTAHP
jgi:hypothetical protein